ncbi:acyltransferase family protein [Acerihabitans arboris]|uniref:Acyltransferase family protein n=1 Tax=Acerihabitans arboris TaxID=2691583 RepID=A0A845SK02_9GAMM|nr:acyltransferase family protein [Acerihabitans arboris]NDL64279.1 acyltransferase family protein [Acerihabitans arboris]
MATLLQDRTSPGFYRRDIDGLRALAILLVLSFHSGLTLFPSGFIGVDIFFVISGYLITNIITSDIKKDTFSVTEFYRRRLWRIQPALIAMWLVVLGFISLTYLPDDYIKYLHSQKYSSLLLANHFFSRQTAEYASPDSATFPLLHTWSLAVEWQWYFFLPLILMGIKKFIPRFGVEKISYIALFVALATSLSVMYFKSTGGYYFLSTRVYEFLAGACVIFLEQKYRLKVNNFIINNLVAALSAIGIIYVALTPNAFNGYPNHYALVVTLATCTIIFIGVSQRKNLLTGSLSSTPAVYIGKLSYSLYLWHWPVFAINHYIGGEIDAIRIALCLVISVALSLLSYYVVERPLRRAKLPLVKSVVILLLAPALFSSLANKVVERNEGYAIRLGPEYDATFTLQAQYAQKAGNRADCLDGPQDPSACEFGDLTSTKTALLIGDSNSNHFWGFWDIMGNDAHVKITALSTPSCLALPGIYQFDWWKYKNQAYQKCYNNAQRYYELIKNQHYDYVIIGEIWEQYARGPWLINSLDDPRSQPHSQDRMEDALRKALDNVTQSGARPMIMRTIAPMPTGYMACRNREAVLRHSFNRQTCDATPTGSTEDEWTLDLFKKMSESFPPLKFIDPKLVQCPEGKCVTELGGVGIYRDVGHITDYASYVFGERYLKQAGNPLK